MESKDIFSDINLDEILDSINKKDTFAEKWFINYTELDKIQKEIYEDESCNFMVKGCAGSGKTILAIHKLYKILAKKDKNFESYLFTVYTKALLKFIIDGFHIFLQENEVDQNLFDFNLNNANIINIDKINMETLSRKEYLILDEFQDLDEKRFEALVSKFNNKMIFGDDEQQLYHKEDALTVDKVKEIIGEDIKVYELNTTYRLPFEIANFCSEIINSSIDKKCKVNHKKGYKPNVIKCPISNNQNLYFEYEIDFIVEEIFSKDLKDVAIIVHNRTAAKLILELVKSKIDNIYDEKIRVLRKKPQINFKIDDNYDKLSFVDKNSITIMVFHSSKGTQFENVFIPKCDCESIYSDEFNYDKALFVACTRTSKNLYITHSKKLTKFISKINTKKFKKYSYNNGIISEK
ncbi:AAA family ATPase [Clostridium perfringens]|uniref:AAA family ATPase n=1 Tax=Clostridium perfringens TaxID=1502 RepID=UPI0024BCFC9B|nr:AAA family ATPase [Clostridium perfringens]EJT6154505.1 AAA family ATPase [Clostridium perfringens]WEV15732.1 AAA family ATPase [Clostridium perfringens D]